MVRSSIFAVAALVAALSASTVRAQDTMSTEDRITEVRFPQRLNGRTYAAVPYEDLKTYFDKLCRFDPGARVLGRRVAVVGAMWSKPGTYQALLDDGPYDALFNPGQPKSILAPGPGRIDPLFMKLRQGQVDRGSRFFSECDGALARYTKACVVAVFGTVRRKTGIVKKNGGAGVFVSAEECFIEVDGVRRVAIQDRTRWIGSAALEGAVAGFNAGKALIVP